MAKLQAYDVGSKMVSSNCYQVLLCCENWVEHPFESDRFGLNTCQSFLYQLKLEVSIWVQLESTPYENPGFVQDLFMLTSDWMRGVFDTKRIGQG